MLKQHKWDFNSIKNIVTAAELLQDSGKSEDADNLLADLAKDIKSTLKEKD